MKFSLLFILSLLIIISTVFANELSFSGSLERDLSYTESKLSIGYKYYPSWGKINTKYKQTNIKTITDSVLTKDTLVGLDYYITDKYGSFILVEVDETKDKILFGIMYDFRDLKNRKEDLKLSYAIGKEISDNEIINIGSFRFKFENSLDKDSTIEFIYWNIHEFNSLQNNLIESINLNTFYKVDDWKYGFGFYFECLNQIDCIYSTKLKYILIL